MNAACPYALYLGRLAPNSQRSIASQLNSIADLLRWPEKKREMMYHKIDFQQASHIKALLIANGWSARSINRAMTAIRSIVGVAVMSGMAPEMQLVQLRAISKVSHGAHDGKPLSVKQVQTLFAHLKQNTSVLGIRNYAVLATLLGTGLRRSELVALLLQDYVAGSALIVRKGKGNKSRTVHLPEWARHALNEWLVLRGKQEGYLFHRVARGGNIQHDTHLSSCAVYSLIRKSLSAIGIEGVSPHDLRRTFITRLLEQNVDLNTVRQMAGHADISTTIMYDKRSEKVMQQAASLLSYKL
ncbi:tyrosine-type recombinase/integrase [Alteromonas macleodii]|uniref:tyrosine-type recombinase/integrase n=1 Tax=Alteromonas macleodii TaxID=28108 RepID=UPI00298281F9|nr:tyrosine-type recombinase/integrase [Alteromonas macleodii]MDW5286714.1 tyrosine-type recombinase/integrase [Alteromonas macleodii]